MTTILNLEQTEARFQRLGLDIRFSPEERAEPLPTNIVDCPHPVFGFRTPQANAGLSIINLRQLLGCDPRRQPAFFDHPWYLEEDFAQIPCPPGWHFLTMEVVPDTISQPINYGRSFWTRGWSLPLAVEVVLMLFLHYAGTGEQLLGKKHTWCSDRASLDRWVTVGAFGRNGLFISGHPGEFASRGLGICARLPNP